MKFSAYTRGFKNDYRWSSPPEFPLNEYVKEDGIVVYRNADGTFFVYLCSGATDKTDYQQRKISVALFINGCSESKAKGFAYWALQHFGNTTANLERCIKYYGTDHWELDENAVKQFADSVVEIDVTEKFLKDRTENANTEENRRMLMYELLHYDFSPKNGLILCVDDGIKTGEKLDEIRSQAQRYLTGKAVAKILEAEKKVLPIFDYINQFGEYVLPFALILFGFAAGLLFASIGRGNLNLVLLQEQIKIFNKKLDAVDKNIDTLKTDLQQSIEKLKDESQKSKNTPLQIVPPQPERKPLSS
ncbi:MAG: hypothetical protein LBT46_06115 [Planctomycetaceae bacterium]|nr:hypothetical protein [Planctomycetaceae bacterium]